MAAQALHELPELRKMDNRLLSVHEKNKMANVGSSHNGCAKLGTQQPSQRDMPRDFAQYATIGEVEAES
jgi:hypothetical protein